MKLLQHFMKQPMRDKNIKAFIDMLSGEKGKILIILPIKESVYLYKCTLQLLPPLIHSQYSSSDSEAEGHQRLASFKHKAGKDFEKYIRDKIEKAGYLSLSSSTEIGGLDYDVLAFSESKQGMLIVETKFKDPPPSSFSAHTLIKQELLLEEYGQLPEIIRHQERYD